jgi:hypothetical protein
MGTDQNIHDAYLATLRQQRAEKKIQFDELGLELRKLTDAIAALENLGAKNDLPVVPSIMVEAAQYKGWKANHALAHIMRANPRPYKARDLADALLRGGQAKEMRKAFQNAKYYLQLWRGTGLSAYNDADHTWILTQKGRDELESASSVGRLPSEQSLFAGRK